MGPSHSSFFLCPLPKSVSLRPEDRTLELSSFIPLPPKLCGQLVTDPILLAPQIKTLHKSSGHLTSSSFFSNSILYFSTKFNSFLGILSFKLKYAKGKRWTRYNTFSPSFIFKHYM